MSLAALQKIAGAQASKGGNYIKDGRYRLVIDKVLCEAKTDGDFFIVEFKVATAEPVEPGVTPNQPGTTCSIALNLTKHKSAAGNAKSFILGVFGEDETKVSTEEFLASLKEATSEKQPLRGMLVDDETYRKPIRAGANAGKPITLHSWSAVPNQSPDDIKKRRAELEASGG